jgi:hypothetical protein
MKLIHPIYCDPLGVENLWFSHFANLASGGKYDRGTRQCGNEGKIERVCNLKELSTDV